MVQKIYAYGLRINRPQTCDELLVAANPQCMSSFTPLFPKTIPKKMGVHIICALVLHSAPYRVVTCHRFPLKTIFQYQTIFQYENIVEISGGPLKLEYYK